MKAKNFGLGGFGLRNRIPMPRFMNGVVKSTAFSLSAVIVRSVIAKCFSYTNTYTPYLNMTGSLNK